LGLEGAGQLRRGLVARRGGEGKYGEHSTGGRERVTSHKKE